MVMDNIKTQCWIRLNDLLESYFPDEEQNEVLGASYTLDLPLKVAAEMKASLEELWENNAPEGSRTFAEIMGAGRLNSITYDSYLESLTGAYKDAVHTTLWEKLTKTNHEDTIVYKGLLKACTKEILETMVKDLLNE